jgi:phosphotransferase system IIA component
MSLIDENIESLQQLIDAPFLGKVPKVTSTKHAGHYLDLAELGL